MSCPKKTNRGFCGWLRGFGCAARGVARALARERNLRIHVTAAVLVVFAAARYYRLSGAEWAVLALCIGLVIACELINTAVESAVDLATSSWHPLAGLAKDAAAGAVLLSAITSVVVGVLLLWDVPTLKTICADLLAHPLLVLLAAAVAALWIALPQRRTHHENEDV